jgi:hypothetical protein
MGSLFKIKTGTLLEYSPLEVKNEHRARHRGLESHDSASQGHRAAYAAGYTQGRSRTRRPKIGENCSKTWKKEKLNETTASAVRRSAPEWQVK